MKHIFVIPYVFYLQQ